MRSIEPLLAKTKKGIDARPEETLTGHTQEVLKAAEVILNSLRQSGPRGIIEKNWDRFRYLVILAAGLHDMGKATNLFQAMLAGDKVLGKKTHPVRHEVLSALLIAQLESPLKNWLETVLSGVGDEFRWQVSWVAGGHHLKLHKDQPYLKKDTDRLVRLQGAQ